MEKEYTFKTIGKHSIHEENNKNEAKLVNFVASKNIASTCFQHKNIHKQTWVSPGHRIANQIDDVIIGARHYSDVIDVRSYRKANMYSNHYLVIAKLRARFYITKTTRREEKRTKQRRYAID